MNIDDMPKLDGWNLEKRGETSCWYSRPYRDDEGEIKIEHMSPESLLEEFEIGSGKLRASIFRYLMRSSVDADKITDLEADMKADAEVMLAMAMDLDRKTALISKLARALSSGMPNNYVPHLKLLQQVADMGIPMSGQDVSIER
jgi:hypothetical protein